jgi:hypothetical protein
VGQRAQHPLNTFKARIFIRNAAVFFSEVKNLLSALLPVLPRSGLKEQSHAAMVRIAAAMRSLAQRKLSIALK